MAKESVNSFYKKSIILFSSMFLILAGFFSKTVDAVVYFGNYYGGGLFGFGGSDLLSLYYSASGWFDFALFFMFFYSIADLVFSKKFGEERSAKGLALAVGLMLSLGATLYQMANGLVLWDWAGPIVIMLGVLLTFATVFLALNLLGFLKWLSAILSAIVTLFVWTRLWDNNFIDLGDFSNPLGAAGQFVLGFIVLFLAVKILAGLAKHKGKIKFPKIRRNKTSSVPPPVPDIIDDVEYTVSPVGEPIPRSKGALLPGKEQKASEESKDYWKQTNISKERILQLYLIVRKIRSLLTNCSKKSRQIEGRLAGLKIEIQKETTLSRDIKNLNKRIDKAYKDLSYFEKTLHSESITLDGIENLKTFFEGIMRDINKILSEVSHVNSVKMDVKAIVSYSSSTWNETLKDLKENVVVLRSELERHLKKSARGLTLRQVLTILSTWKKNLRSGSSRQVTNSTAKQKDSNQENVESVFREVVLKTHPDKTRNFDEARREKLRRLFEQATAYRKVGDLNSLIGVREEVDRIYSDYEAERAEVKRKNLAAGVDIEEFENLLSFQIMIPKSHKKTFVSGTMKKRKRGLNVANFASHVIFTPPTGGEGNAKIMRQQLTEFIPNAMSAVEEIKKYLDKMAYYSRDSKTYKQFTEIHNKIIKYKSIVDDIQTKVLSKGIIRSSYRSFTRLTQADPTFIEKLSKKFKIDPSKITWGSVVSDPDKLAFFLMYPGKNYGQKGLYDFFDRAYDYFIDLDIQLEKMRNLISRKIKKGLKYI